MPRKHAPSKAHSGQNSHSRHLIWLWAGLGVLLLVIAGIWILRPGAAPVAAEPTSAPAAAELTVAQAYDKLLEGAFFLDVRTQEEWADFHIAGSTLIPLSELTDRLDELPRDQDIVVVCRSGHRSLTAANILQQAGFTRLSSLSGGLQAWLDANYPLEK